MPLARRLVKLGNLANETRRTIIEPLMGGASTMIEKIQPEFGSPVHFKQRFQGITTARPHTALVAPKAQAPFPAPVATAPKPPVAAPAVGTIPYTMKYSVGTRLNLMA
jgi:hypothetical protein